MNLKNCFDLSQIKRLFRQPASLLAASTFLISGKETRVLGISDTDPQNSIVWFLYSILENAGRKVAALTSQEDRFSNPSLQPDISPVNLEKFEPFRLYRLLNETRYRGYDYIILEVPLEGINTGLFRHLPFEIFCLHDLPQKATSITASQDLVLSLSRVFKKSKSTLLNKQISIYPLLAPFTGERRISYSLQGNTQVTPVKLQHGEWGTFFYYVDQNSAWKNQLSFERSVKFRLGKNFAPAALAAIAVATALKVPDFKIKEGIEDPVVAQWLN